MVPPIYFGFGSAQVESPVQPVTMIGQAGDPTSPLPAAHMYRSIQLGQMGRLVTSHQAGVRRARRGVQ